MLKVLVVGANFENKGAQSMLFVTIDELKKRFTDCDIYYAGLDVFEDEKYAFKELFYPEAAKNIALGNNVILNIFKCSIKDCIKTVVRRKTNLWRFMDVKKLYQQLDLIIDISGFNLGKKWSVEIHEAYLNNIRLAMKYNIPMLMMPQSFGPFDYAINEQYLRQEIKELLNYPKLIFAREQDGYSALKELGLRNIKLSTDLVLQNKGIEYENIYKKKIKLYTPQVSQGNSVGIIPNTQCFNHGDKLKNIELYREVISELISQGKEIYIFRHSTEDLDVCKRISQLFDGEKTVHLIEREFSCLEYDDFIRNFDFIICSRYHGLVHAYRNYVPCIALGWAVKYYELAQNVGQDRYVFDITSNQYRNEDVVSAIRTISNNLAEEKDIIKENIAQIRMKNCFDYVSEWMNKYE